MLVDSLSLSFREFTALVCRSVQSALTLLNLSSKVDAKAANNCCMSALVAGAPAEGSCSISPCNMLRSTWKRSINEDNFGEV